MTGWKRYSKSGESQVKDIKRGKDGTIKENLIIKGNNLLALHSLKEEFAGKVKLIYVDPPYNTGNDEFQYNDNFNHSSWLTFMKNRLEAAKELLQNDGVIFVHCDDNEQAYLKVLSDDVFGRENFIGMTPRHTRSGKSDVSYKFSQDYDWILSYTKAAATTSQLFSRIVERKYYKSPDYSDRWRLADITSQRTIKERPNSNFTMINPKNGEKYPVNPNRSWAVTKSSFQEYYDNGKIVFPGDYTFLKITKPAMRVFECDDKGKASYISSDFILNAESGYENTLGNKHIDAIFGERKFSYSKPEKLLYALISAVTSEGDIVLDYHLGSGTTATAAHKMNRQYIGIEQMDYIETITVERLKKVIAGEQSGISKAVDWKGGGDFIYLELAKWNQAAKEKINSCKSLKELESFFEQMYEKYFLNYNLKLKEFKEKVLQEAEFRKLPLDEQKRMFLTMLDLNQMYVNKSEMADAKYAISKEDQKLTAEFYGED